MCSGRTDHMHMLMCICSLMVYGQFYKQFSTRTCAGRHPLGIYMHIFGLVCIDDSPLEFLGCLAERAAIAFSCERCSPPVVGFVFEFVI